MWKMHERFMHTDSLTYVSYIKQKVYVWTVIKVNHSYKLIYDLTYVQYVKHMLFRYI